MNLLKRELAPIVPEAWKEIDDEAKRVLELNLGARKLVSHDGPHGWEYAAVNLGRLRILDSKTQGVHRGLREVLPLAELRVPVRLKIMELDGAARGAEDPDLSPLVDAAESMAQTEDQAIIGGDSELGIGGIAPASSHEPIQLGKKPEQYLHAIVDGVERLRNAGVDGPFGLALCHRTYAEIFRASEEGYPISQRLSSIIDGPIVRSTALEGAILMSVRGGDFVLTSGQDLAVGYAHHDADEVELYLTESFTFRVLEPAAAISLHRAT